MFVMSFRTFESKAPWKFLLMLVILVVAALKMLLGRSLESSSTFLLMLTSKLWYTLSSSLYSFLTFDAILLDVVLFQIKTFFFLNPLLNQIKFIFYFILFIFKLSQRCRQFYCDKPISGPSSRELCELNFDFWTRGSIRNPIKIGTKISQSF